MKKTELGLPISLFILDGFYIIIIDEFVEYKF